MAQEQGQASLRTVDGVPVLRLERRLPHPPEKVWRAVTEPAELKHWFPATVEFPATVDLPAGTELRPGTLMRFTFEEGGPTTDGVVLECDPPKVYAFRWNDDVLRFELVPDGAGCRLIFTHTHGGTFGRLGANRNAAGWDVCLASLVARLDGRDAPAPPGDMLSPMEEYTEKFGLAEGEVTDAGDGYLVRFARDLVWKPVDEAWALFTEDEEPAVGAEPPLRFINPYVPAGQVSAVQPPHVIEYEWLHDGKPAGRVRFELAQDPRQGTRVVLTQTLPAELADLRPVALAAWQTHLELYFAALHGQVRPWPEGRTEELTERYRTRLS